MHLTRSTLSITRCLAHLFEDGLFYLDLTMKKNLSIEEVAEWLGVDDRTVYRLAQSGSLPGFKVGRQWRFSEDVLRSWVDDRMTIERLKQEERSLGYPEGRIL